MNKQGELNIWYLEEYYGGLMINTKEQTREGEWTGSSRRQGLHCWTDGRPTDALLRRCPFSFLLATLRKVFKHQALLSCINVFLLYWCLLTSLLTLGEISHKLTNEVKVP